MFLALGGVSAVAGYEMAPSRGGDWHEIAWPFPRDGWPAGRAFRCRAADCGADVEVYVRPKLGFCNCDSGVADDGEVDRVADVDMISPRFTPLKAGDVVYVADMRGRIRAYDIDMPGGKRSAIGIAVSQRCDLLVAAAQGRGDPARVQRAVLTFLAAPKIKMWMAATMEGR
ncbi:hypothetical protein MTX26_07140 [Bradyrhizobium sp. ISRA443]|uniref:hypothetical protein n=1 Tax=unclassified Bradyrhizobium TaxID=2631580 RepID=UPI00247836FE|nr:MULTISPECIES: hypothetical protein [unclassified Bradyrhizobium]WGS02589.1 hypothetical protein MTX23_07135 [Bradyrhizobium sp. ISRA436]WGS09474.1 hypothetical protein MTX18_07135 [Bradyrhizobium sp. ISRA437]WGS16361.1 hypothetical protein MTX26_07140 [Bradyrhizobium sp. ISRA443]